jgi:hypothetical protein
LYISFINRNRVLLYIYDSCYIYDISLLYCCLSYEDIKILHDNEEWLVESFGGFWEIVLKKIEELPTKNLMSVDKVPLQQLENQTMLITPTQSGSPNQFVTNIGYEETQIQTLARSVFNEDPTPSYKEVPKIGSPYLELKQCW